MDFFQLAVPGKEFRFIEQVGKLIKDDTGDTVGSAFSEF